MALVHGFRLLARSCGDVDDDFMSRRIFFSSVQDSSYALGEAHMRSTPSVGSFPSVAFETV